MIGLFFNPLRAGVLCLGIVIPGVLSGAPVRAQSAAPAAAPVDHEVILRSGEELKGELVELIPDQLLVLRIPSGEMRRIRWADIERQRSLAPALTPSVPLPPMASEPLRPQLGGVPVPTAVLPPSLSLRDPSMVKVHLDNNNPAAKLYRKRDVQYVPVSELRPGSGYYDWQPACEGTCDVDLMRMDRYRIDGDGIQPSPGFRLPFSPTGELTLYVNAGSRGRRKAGRALTVVGSIVAVFGIATLGGTYLFTSTSSTTTQSTCTPYSFCNPTPPPAPMDSASSGRTIGYAVGGSLLGAGVAMLIPGIAFLINSSTTVSSSLGPLEFE